MFKKILLPCMVSALAATASISANAGNFYMGPSLVYQDITASNSDVRGMRPKLTLGYGEMINCYHLAGELFYSPGIATFSDNHDTGFPSTKITHQYGASVLPGMMINEATLGYARLGVVASEFSGPSTTRTGGQLGVGLQTKMTEKWDVRIEYIYTTYPSIAGLGAPYTNEGVLGFTYKFN